MTAAETGHLVLGTLHTKSAAKTLDRMISAFPPDVQNQVRTMASESVRAIISQVLVPRTDKPGMTAAYELLVNTPGIQNLIREMKIYQIPSAIQTGGRLGMVSMEQSLRKLVLDKVVASDTIEEYLPKSKVSSAAQPPAGPAETGTNDQAKTSFRSATKRSGFKFTRR